MGVEAAQVGHLEDSRGHLVIPILVGIKVLILVEQILLIFLNNFLVVLLHLDDASLHTL
jgi:hypothetical protein